MLNLLIILTAVVAVYIISDGAIIGQSFGEKYIAILNGSSSVPPVNTNSSGIAEINIEENNSTFYVKVNDISNFTVAHIHKGLADENGPHVFTLLTANDTQNQQETIEINGTLSKEGFEGPLLGKSMDNLTELMNNGSAYVNIHTEEYPKEFLRGKIMPENPLLAVAYWLIDR